MGYKKDEPNVRSLSDLLKRPHRWARAAFTSFTFNVGFFDSAIMVRLRDLGCNRCDVYLDRLGYTNSLIERQSKFLGLYYRLHEVAPRHEAGIFHPKLVHLWDAKGEEDVLLVGSGNLTFAGHGQQAEVMECLTSRDHGPAFVEAAAFFAELAASSKTSEESRDSLGETASRLREVGLRGVGTDAVRFIHSLDRSGIDQFTDSLADRNVEELLVVSPFHHPLGDPLKQLVARIKPTRLLVGLPHSAERAPIALNLPQKVIKVFGARAEDDVRYVHAKWYEARGKGFAVALTGSFNATTASFCSTSNVEAGVLRVMPVRTPTWKRVDYPTEVSPLEDFESEPPEFIGLTASVRQRVLSGSANHAPDGLYQGVLSDGLKTLASVQVQIEDGKFTHKLKNELKATSALQLTLEGETVRIRGWVNLEDILRLSSAEKQLLANINDFEAGRETADTHAAVIAHFKHCLHALSEDLEKAKTPEGTQASGNRPSAVFKTSVPVSGMSRADYDAASVSNPSGGLPGLHSARSNDSLRRILDAILGLRSLDFIRTPVRDLKPDLETDDESEAVTEAEVARDEHEQRELRRQYLDVQKEVFDRIPQARQTYAYLNSDEVKQHTEETLQHLINGLLVAQLRATGLHALAESDDVIAPLSDWLRRVTMMQHPRRTKQALLHGVCGVAAILAAKAHKEGPDHSKPIKLSDRPLENVVWYLEYFYCGRIPVDEVLSHAERFLSSEAAEREIGDKRDDILTKFIVSLDTMTLLYRVNHCFSTEQMPSSDAAHRDQPNYVPFAGDLFNALARAVKNPTKARPYPLFAKTPAYCLKYHPLIGYERLPVDGFLYCPDCQTPYYAAYKLKPEPLGEPYVAERP